MVVLVFSCLSANEPTNFDYNDHGKDWERCPKNGNFVWKIRFKSITYFTS